MGSGPFLPPVFRGMLGVAPVVVMETRSFPSRATRQRAMVSTVAAADAISGMGWP
jgi:hypothetical protein